MPDDVGGLGEQQPRCASKGEVVKENAVYAVQEGCQRVDDAVDGEFLELLLEEFDGGKADGAEDGGASKSAEEEARGGRPFFADVEGAVYGGGVGVVGQKAKRDRTVARVNGVEGVFEGFGARVVGAVCDNALHVVRAGGFVGKDFGVDFVDDAHAVLQEAECGCWEDAVADFGDGGEGGRGFCRDD